jgi:hypothetical protein
MTDPAPTPTPPTPTSLPAVARSYSYDTVVKTNKIKIKKINSYEYEIKIIKSNDALMYQVFDENSSTLNNSRRILSVPLLKWHFYAYVWNKGKDTDIPFTPTTVMEICNKQYIFVINNTIIKKGKVIFQISTKDINYGKLNKLSKIKTGYFKNVRFDIDKYIWTTGVCEPSGGRGVCTMFDCIKWNNSGGVCPQGAVFNSMCSVCCIADSGQCLSFIPTSVGLVRDGKQMA